MSPEPNKRHGANGVAKTTFERDLSWEEGRAMMIDVTQKAISNGALIEEEGKVIYEAKVDEKFVRVVTMKLEDIKDPAMMESVLNEIDPQTGVVISSIEVTDPYNPIDIEIYATVSMYPIEEVDRKTKDKKMILPEQGQEDEESSEDDDE